MSHKNILKQNFPSVLVNKETKYEEYLLIDAKDTLSITREFKNQNFNLILEFAIEEFDEYKGITLIYVFEKEGNNKLLILQSRISSSAESIGDVYPLAILFEREIKDGFGIAFNQSLDDRKLFLHECYPHGFHPLKKSFKNTHIKLKEGVLPSEEYSFNRMEGEGIYEIPVGPIHAGIIAPGHFRFNVLGETILNLEIRHFWKHRGIEKMVENKTPEQAIAYAENICGDETVANALAYCLTVERIAGITIPKRAESIRILFAEMERIYSLLGDIAGMIVDVAFPKGASQFLNLREEILRWNEMLSGSRFYKDSLIIGGIKKDIGPYTVQELSSYINYFNNVFRASYLKILENASVIDRFETTGIIKKELINPLNITGPVARASGVNKDERRSHPYSQIYEDSNYSNKILEEGDVLARFRIKTNTINNSVNIIMNILKKLPNGPINTAYSINDGYAFSIVESPRGQNIVFVHIKDKKISRFKVRTASFCNWYAIEHAVMGNIVPDFPLINKSLNLSYEGNDL